MGLDKPYLNPSRWGGLLASIYKKTRPQFIENEFFSLLIGESQGFYFKLAKAAFTLATASVSASSEAAVERRKQFGAPNEPPPTSAT